MKKFNNVEELKNTINKNNPFTRLEYIAMLLGMHTTEYTIDREDEKIHYGDRMSNLKARLVYLKCERLLSKREYHDNVHLLNIRKLFQEKKYNDILLNITNNPIFKKLGIVFEPWIYFKSKELDENIKDFSSVDIKHRLYLTLGLDYRAFFSKLFIENCVSENLPYYFKVFSRKGQTDTVVIYADSEESLLSYVNIINSIYDRYPNIKNNTKLPAPHLCKVNDYIGYGFEPKTSDQLQSYTQFMISCVSMVSDKISNLRKKVFDFYRSRGFEKMSKNEKFEFLKVNSKEFYNIFGLEIEEIFNEIRFQIASEKGNNNKRAR